VDPAFDFIVCTRVHTFNSGISPSWSGSFGKYVIITIALDHSGAQHRLQFHHIFPKAVLKSSYSAREADDIANLAFIGGKTNRAISDKPPVGYFPALIEEAGPPVFEAQCIPTDMKLLDVPRYKAFLGERRQIVARRINKFLGTEV